MNASIAARDIIKDLKQNRKMKKAELPQRPSSKINFKLVIKIYSALFLILSAYFLFQIDWVPKHKIYGTIKLNGKILKHGCVIFAFKNDVYNVPTDNCGKYEVNAHHGTYAVAIMGHDDIPSKYQNLNQTPLKADVFHDKELDFSIK